MVMVELSLEEYKGKRDFSRTDEPGGDVVDSDAEPIFVVQKHDASTLHYDLRLEMDGVLRSWAVPKEPPLKPGVKRLAIPTEDHPISYASFEGEIPEGEYGAGTVEIWDDGTYNLVKEEEREIIFELHGFKMKGTYVMIKTKGYGGNKDSWLLFRKKQT